MRITQGSWAKILSLSWVTNLQVETAHDDHNNFADMSHVVWIVDV